MHVCRRSCEGIQEVTQLALTLRTSLAVALTSAESRSGVVTPAAGTAPFPVALAQGMIYIYDVHCNHERNNYAFSNLWAKKTPLFVEAQFKRVRQMGMFSITAALKPPSLP